MFLVITVGVLLTNTLVHEDIWGQTDFHDICCRFYGPLRMNHNVSVNVVMLCMLASDRLATCPGCTLPVTECMLGGPLIEGGR